MNSEIERLAKEAGLHELLLQEMPAQWHWDELNVMLPKFAALVAELCAKECEATHQRRAAVGNRQGFNAIMDCVDAIRAKFALSDK